VADSDSNSKSSIQPALWALPVRRPGLIWLVGLIVTAASVVAIARFEQSASVTSMFDQRNPAAAALGKVMDRFSAIDELLILVTADADVSDEEAADRLVEFAASLEKKLRQSPADWKMCRQIHYRLGAEHRTFIEEHMVPGGLYYLSDSELDQLEERLTPDQIHRQIRQNQAMMAAPGPGTARLAKKLLQDPLRLREFLAGRLEQMPSMSDQSDGALFSDDGRSLLIRIAGAQPSADLQFAQRMVQVVQRAADGIEHDGLTVELSGSYAIADVSQRIVRRDMIRSVIFAVIALHLVFILMYRSFLSFPIALAPVAMGIVTAFGLFRLIDPQLTPLAAVAGGLLGGLGVDYAVHYLSHYSTARSEGLSASQAISGTTRSIGPAMGAACLTTVSGFAAISILGVDALRDFAMIGALGLILALLASLSILPATLRLMDRKEGEQAKGRQVRLPVDRWIGAIARRGVLSMAVCAVILAGAMLICVLKVTSGDPIVALETDVNVMHPKPNAPLRTQARIAQKYSGQSNSLLIHLEAAGPDDLVELAHQVDRRLGSAAVRESGAVRSYSLAQWIADPARRAQVRKRADRFDADRIINDLKAALDQSIFEPSVFGDYYKFLRRLVADPDSPTVATLRQYSTISSQLLARPDDAKGATGESYQALSYVFFDQPLASHSARRKAFEVVRASIEDLPGATLTGLSVIGYDTERAILGDLTQLLWIAGGVILLWLMIYFRNPLDALLCLLPVVFGLGCLIALMHLVDERLNMINLIAVPLLVGIGVDDGIFLVSQYRRARQSRDLDKSGKSKGPIDLVSSMGASSHAIITTSLTTALAFGSLMTAGTEAIQSLGRIVAIGVIACLAGALFGLTPLLIRLSSTDQKSPKS